MAQLTSHLTNCSKVSVKSELIEMDSSFPTGMQTENIKGTLNDKKDDVLLESDIQASDKKFSDKMEVTELGSSIKSEVSSPKSPYVNMEDDKFTIAEIDVKTEESNAELNDASAIIEIPRKRGRPRGTFSTKKGKEIVKALKEMMADTNNVASQQTPRKRGRPLGSFGRKKQYRLIEALKATMRDANHGASQHTPMKRGRPLGSFGRKKRRRIIDALQATMTDAKHGPSQQVPRRRGRPRKNRDKIASETESDTPVCYREISELIKETHAKSRPGCQNAFISQYALSEHFTLHDITYFICVVCHKEFTTNKIDFKLHMQQHCTPDNRGLFNCEHCPRSYLRKGDLIKHYKVKHPPIRVVNDKECSENCERTQQIALVKRETNESDSKIVINKMAEDEEVNDLLELEKAARYEKCCEENELTELVSSMKSEPPSPEPPCVNLEDDKFTIEEADVKVEESSAELNNPSSAIIGSPGTVDNNDPSLLGQDQNQQKKSFKCIECHENFMDAEYLHQSIMSSLSNLQCWICGECCLSEADLTSHMATHDRTYTCKICGKSFLHLLANEKHITHCSLKNLQHHNGNEIFSCEICEKKIKNHTEDELMTCPDTDYCEVLVNGSMDSVKSDASSPETLKISQKSNSSSFHDFNIPILDNRNVPLSDQEVNVKSELNELVDLAKNEPSSPEILKSSQKNSSSSTFHHFNLPKSAAGNCNVFAIDKEFCDESNELEVLAKSKQSASEFCKSCHKNNSSTTSFQQFTLTKSAAVDRIVSTSDKELESSASEYCKSCPRIRLSAPSSSVDLDNLLRDLHNPSKVALRKMGENADASSLAWAVGPTPKRLGGFFRLDWHAVTKVGNHKKATHHYNIPDYKGPYRCKQCPKLFARKSNLTSHCSMAHPPKYYFKNDFIIQDPSSADVHNKLLRKKKLEMLKHHTLPVSNTSGQNVTDSNKKVRESEHSNATIRPETSMFVHKKNWELQKIKIPASEYHEWNIFRSNKEFWEKREMNEVVAAKSEPSFSKSPYYFNQDTEKNCVEEKNTLEKNEKKKKQTKETKAGYIDSFIQFLAGK